MAKMPQRFNIDLVGGRTETYEIATGKNDLRVQMQAHSDMEAVSDANDMALVKDGATGSVIPARGDSHGSTW